MKKKKNKKEKEEKEAEKAREKQEEEARRKKEEKEEEERERKEAEERKTQTKKLINKLEDIKTTFDKVKDKINLQDFNSDDDLTSSGLKTDFNSWFALKAINTYDNVKTKHDDGKGDIGASYFSLLKTFVEKFESKYKSILENKRLLEQQ